MGCEINNKRQDIFTNFPILETERFILEELTDKYLPNLIEEMTDKETMEYSGMVIVDVEKQIQMFLKKIKEMYTTKKGIRWAVIDKKTKKYLGDIGFYNVDLYCNRTELGYTIMRKYWRQGIATECIEKLTRFAFEDIGMNKVILMIDDRNKKSINLAKKLNFKHDGILREEYYLKDANEYISVNIFSKLKKENIMMSYMQRIALKDNEKRREVLTDILKELECPYYIQCERIKDRWVQNIIVSFNKGLPKVVLGAHYDTVEGSTGANDNGSAVCIGLKMIGEFLKTPPSIPLEIVFFDCEEKGLLGSKAYVNTIGNEEILAMINLDICGVGDTIVLAPTKNLEDSVLGNVINKVEGLGKHKVRSINQLPSGDDLSFEDKKIINVSVCVLDDDDIECMIEMFKNKEKEPEKFPKIIATMHNGPQDSIAIIDEKAMEALFDWSMDVIRNF